ncbi:AUGMIN subunit 6 [Selaginella moellendorffii]|uniref:AUGMIN subunit 6 n=1 Tax=Selaginella moellendorffii TaxID=88036 RepID=UPI000D1C4FB4|nr:AUGMIN subunit 6 [Selaginella moellendorffii]|eukprot:XP_024525883.1 AUGMIN subunit 6 [Selaginella moellendorffii]
MENGGLLCKKDVIRDKETEMEATGCQHSRARRAFQALLHFLLAAKDFAGVWPIFDAAHSCDFRKIVQRLINELEAQGALPRSSSRVSSLATCCGQRFVELLWQLSAHALREVHRRNSTEHREVHPSGCCREPLARFAHGSHHAKFTCISTPCRNKVGKQSTRGHRGAARQRYTQQEWW